MGTGPLLHGGPAEARRPGGEARARTTAPAVRSRGASRLLGVELDDELLLDRHGQVLAVRSGAHRALEGLLVQVDPLRHATAVHGLEGRGDPEDLPALLGDL